MCSCSTYYIAIMIITERFCKTANSFFYLLLLNGCMLFRICLHITTICSDLVDSRHHNAKNILTLT